MNWSWVLWLGVCGINIVWFSVGAKAYLKYRKKGEIINDNDKK